MHHVLFVGDFCGTIKIQGIIVYPVGLDKNFLKTMIPAIICKLCDQLFADAFSLVNGINRQVINIGQRFFAVVLIEGIGGETAHYPAIVFGNKDHKPWLFQQLLKVLAIGQHKILHTKNLFEKADEFHESVEICWVEFFDGQVHVVKCNEYLVSEEMCLIVRPSRIFGTGSGEYRCEFFY